MPKRGSFIVPSDASPAELAAIFANIRRAEQARFDFDCDAVRALIHGVLASSSKAAFLRELSAHARKAPEFQVV
jgi:hypothetical protein